MKQLLPPLDAHRGKYVELGGRDVALFAGTDYLGLARDPRVLDALRDGARRFGLSCSASRITSGDTAPHRKLETALAEFLGMERVALTAAGFLAASVALDVLKDNTHRAWIDAQAHGSLFHALEGRVPLAKFPHRDATALAQRIAGEADPGGLIVSDSVFGLRGEIAPLEDLARIASQRSRALLIDDSHALGVLGMFGRGTPALLGELEDLVVVGTLSKSLGAHGGFVAGPADFIAAVQTGSRAYLGATPPPPALCQAASRALEVLIDEPERVARLRQLSHAMRRLLREAGLPAHGHPDLPIFTLDATDGVAPRTLHERLLERGILVPCSLYPGAPEGGLLRWTLQSTHELPEIERLVETLASLVGDRSS